MHGLDWPAAGVGFGSEDAASWGWSSLPKEISASQKVVQSPYPYNDNLYNDITLIGMKYRSQNVWSDLVLQYIVRTIWSITILPLLR